MEETRIVPEWDSFTPGVWQKEINVRDFIQKNYTPYDGDESFLAGPTEDTKALWDQVMDLSRQEREKGGVLDMDTSIVSTITSHGPGYLDKSREKIVGFQTDKPFKRALQPYGGIRMAVKACEQNGYHVDPQIVEFFTKHRKTHNEGVFDAYTPRCGPAAPATSSPACPTPTDGAASWATTAAWPSTAWTGSLRTSSTRRTPPASSCTPASPGSGRS